MKNTSETYGAARLGGRLYAARVENDGTRLSVTSLLTSEEEFSGDKLQSGRLFFNVDEGMAVVKKIRIRHSSFMEIADVMQFEMSQSLLEPADRFYFDALPVDTDGDFRRYLSIAYHRGEIDKMIAAYQEHLRKPSGFKLDAVAMADGYRAFCRKESGELQVLVSVEPDQVSIAILHRERLHAVGQLATTLGETIGEETANTVGAEFKMTLSYLLSDLFQDGITVPPSRIILCGRHARDRLLQESLAGRFTTAITLPQFNDGYFQPVAETLQKYHPEQFLIPLGLAVE